MIPTPQTDNMIMALKCVPKYAKSPTYDYDRAILKLREMEKESSEWQATCLEYKRQAKEAFEYELKSKRDAKCPNCQQSYCISYPLQPNGFLLGMLDSIFVSENDGAGSIRYRGAI